MSSLGRAKIWRYQHCFISLTNIFVWLHTGTTAFYYTNRKSLMTAFQWYFDRHLGPSFDPKPANVPSWPCYHHLYQFMLTPHQTIAAPSADPAQNWNHIINLFMLLTLCLYHVSDGHVRLTVLCPDDITPCLTTAICWCKDKEGCIRGLFSPELSTFRCRRVKRTSSNFIVLVWHCDGCGAGGKEDDENQYDALAMHHALNILIGIYTM